LYSAQHSRHVDGIELTEYEALNSLLPALFVIADAVGVESRLDLCHDFVRCQAHLGYIELDAQFVK